MPPRNRFWAGWLPWACVADCLPSAVLILGCVFGAYREWQQTEAEVLRRQMDDLRAVCWRCAAKVEGIAESEQVAPEMWERFRGTGWFPRWSDAHADDPRKLYLAIVDEAGNIVVHSDSGQIGKSIGREWYDRRLPEAGSDVVHTAGGPLSGNTSAFDVSVPLALSGAQRGEVHAGISPEWLNAQVASQNSQARLNCALLLGLSLIVAVLAASGLSYLVRQNQRLVAALTERTRARALELSNLGAGLAHEVRNPLHALRINLHILRRAIDGRAALPEDQLLATTQESDTAVDRIEAVLRDLLQLVEPTAGKVVDVNLLDEIQAVLGLLTANLTRNEIVVDSSRCQNAAMVSIDAARVRQLLVNLLTFAQHRVGKKGQIDLGMVVTDLQAELAIAHAGPVLTTEQAAHLFEPFRSPVDSGSGLEMALVHAHLLAAGGNVRYEPLVPSGNRLVVSLPIRRSVQKERQHEYQT